MVWRKPRGFHGYAADRRFQRDKEGAKFVTFVNSSLVSFSNLQLLGDSIRKVVSLLRFSLLWSETATVRITVTLKNKEVHSQMLGEFL